MPKSSRLVRASSRTPSPQLETRVKVEVDEEDREPSTEEDEEQTGSQRVTEDVTATSAPLERSKSPAAPAPFPYAPAPATSRRFTYDLVLLNVPDVHPAYVLHLMNLPDFHADANDIVAELLTNEYPLAGGGWNQGGATPAAGFTMRWRQKHAELPKTAKRARQTPVHEPVLVYQPVVVPVLHTPSPTRQYGITGPIDAFDLAYGYQRAGTGIFGGGGWGGAASGGSWTGGKGTRADDASTFSQTLGKSSQGRDEPPEVKRQRLMMAAMKRAHSESQSQSQG